MEEKPNVQQACRVDNHLVRGQYGDKQKKSNRLAMTDIECRE